MEHLLDLVYGSCRGVSLEPLEHRPTFPEEKEFVRESMDSSLLLATEEGRENEEFIDLKKGC